MLCGTIWPRRYELELQVPPSPSRHWKEVKEECDGVLAAVEEAVAKSAKPINLKTCLVQFWDGVSNVAPDDAEIKNLRTNAPSEKSADIIHEHMCGLQFSLSATAFFQVNTVAAEALYRLAGEWASPGGQSLLLDVCCGTGTIGLTLARAVKVRHPGRTRSAPLPHSALAPQRLAPAAHREALAARAAPRDTRSFGRVPRRRACGREMAASLA